MSCSRRRPWRAVAWTASAKNGVRARRSRWSSIRRRTRYYARRRMTRPPKVWAVVVGGGSGQRFGRPKQYETPRRRAGDRSVPPHRRSRSATAWSSSCPAADAEREVGVAGGATRSESVRAGLAAVPADADIVCVHDAARPLATAALYRRVIDAVDRRRRRRRAGRRRDRHDQGRRRRGRRGGHARPGDAGGRADPAGVPRRRAARRARRRRARAPTTPPWSRHRRARRRRAGRGGEPQDHRSRRPRLGRDAARLHAERGHLR